MGDTYVPYANTSAMYGGRGGGGAASDAERSRMAGRDEDRGRTYVGMLSCGRSVRAPFGKGEEGSLARSRDERERTKVCPASMAACRGGVFRGGNVYVESER